MVVHLPDDILHIVCEMVAEDRHDDPRRAFDTLYTCAVSSRRLCIPALTILYRFQHAAPIKGGSDTLSPAEHRLGTQKWSILWHSIISSCFKKTAFPYCRYVQVLDFRDLHAMLEDDMFHDQVFRNFFKDDMQQFRIVLKNFPKFARGRAPIVDRAAVIDAIGEELTKHTPVAQSITGPVLASALLRWIPRLPRLRSLQLWEGSALDDERLPNLITVHCPEFEDLSIYQWVGMDQDHKLSAFISGLPANRLRGFTTFSATAIAAETFLALNGHGQSLRELKIYLDADAIPHLGLLKGCTQLETLEISDSSGATDIEASQNDVFLDVVAWLRGCHSLRRLSFTHFRSAASVLAQVLWSEDIRLEQLKVDLYSVREQSAFHLALTNQPALASLSLEGNSEGISADDRAVCVDSLCQLRQLRDLKLDLRSDEVDLLTDNEIGRLAGSLPELEELYTSGYGVTDAVLEPCAALRNLRRLTFLAVTSFTTDGLLRFVERLGPGNQELALFIDNADPTSAPLSVKDQNRVRDALGAKVGGRFEYQLIRDDYEDSYSDDSD